MKKEEVLSLFRVMLKKGDDMPTIILKDNKGIIFEDGKGEEKMVILTDFILRGGFLYSEAKDNDTMLESRFGKIDDELKLYEKQITGIEIYPGEEIVGGPEDVERIQLDFDDLKNIEIIQILTEEDFNPGLWYDSDPFL